MAGRMVSAAPVCPSLAICQVCIYAVTVMLSSDTGIPRPITVPELVERCLERRPFFLDLAGRHGSPLYIIEQQSLLDRAGEFLATFRPLLPDIRLFYPVKANSHPDVIQTMIGAGLGIEVSSGQELADALAAGAREILFNGPGKTDAEQDLALAHAGQVTVIMDSFNELERLSARAAATDCPVRAGIRLAVADEVNGWSRFGIPLDRLPAFAEQAFGCSHISLQGLHFHTSWNMSPTAQVAMLERIGAVLPTLRTDILANLTFIDIGGGFWPEWGEWLPMAETERRDGQGPFHTTAPAAPLQCFAEAIAAACRQHIFPHLRCSIYAEPGRRLCAEAASILLMVQDCKDNGVSITDGGANMVGWEQFETCYFPIINLTRPDTVERPCLLTGSLCAPRDLWGRSYFGSELRCGDLLLIPFQGAYTYSLRQQFIKPLPKTVFVPAGLGGRPHISTERPWGLSCSVDIYNCNPQTIRNPEAIRRFVAELCALINMRPFGETQVAHFGEDERVAGFSMTQLIETSLISGHFANQTNTAYLDIFSCSPYEPEQVAAFARQFFGGSQTLVNVTVRR